MSSRPKAASKARRLLRERLALLDEPVSRNRDDQLADIDRELVALVPLLLNVIENGGAPGVKPQPWLTEKRKRQQLVPREYSTSDGYETLFQRYRDSRGV